MNTTGIMLEPTNVPIKEYITNIRNKYYPDLDISFMDFFMDMYDNDELIDAEILSKYGILGIKSGRKSIQASDYNKLFKQRFLVENIDYRIRRLQTSNSKRGAPKDVYHITPKAFKICLIGSGNESKYRDYYLFLEECVYYYNKGQMNTYKEKIENLEEDLRYVHEELHYVHEELHYVEKEKETLESKLDKLMAKMDLQSEEMKVQSGQLTDLQITVNKISNKLDSCAHIPTDDELADRFVLMKKNKESNEYYVIRSQERRINKAINEKTKSGYMKIPDLIESETIPNSIYLWNNIKDVLVKENRIICKYNDITLNQITEQDFISMIKQVFDSRKDYN